MLIFFLFKENYMVRAMVIETEAAKAGACLHHDPLHNRNPGSIKHGVDLQAEAQSSQH